MKKTILILLCLLSFSAAAAPVASVSASRTTGVVPLCVFFDATATTDASVIYPFHDLIYKWNFGNTNAGNWTAGANTNLSKNGATGPVAAHCYETAGTYTVDMSACNSTTCDKPDSAITITASAWVDGTHGGTVCITNGADPTGAGVCTYGVGNTSDFDSAVGTALATGCGGSGCQRVLLKRGDIFSASAATNIVKNGPGIIGAYGTGAKPVVNASNNVAILQPSTNLASGYSDWRIMDLDLRGNNTDNGVSGILSIYPFNQLTVMRVDVSGLNKGIFVSNSSHDQVFLIDNTASSITGGSGSLASYNDAQRSAYMGNYFDPNGGEHSLRVQTCFKCVVSNNTLLRAGGAAGSKHAFTLRALEYLTPGYANDAVTQYVVMSDNIYGGSTAGAWTVFIGPEASVDSRVVDTITERNWFIAGSGQTEAIHLSTYARTTVRNNIFNLTGALSHAGIGVRRYSTVVYPDLTWIYNNTIYSGDTDNDFIGVNVDSQVTNTTVKNNLSYAPNDSQHYSIACNDSQTLTTCTNAPGLLVHSNNSANSGSSGVPTSPLFDGPLTEPKGFRIATTSYGQNAGTAIFPASNDDFFNCDDVTANAHIGAMVPRARATCRGVK